MPKKPCSGKYGSCPNLVNIGEKYCSVCQPKARAREQEATRAYDRKRGTPAQRGYDSYWKKVRAHKLKQSPLCEKCVELGFAADSSKLVASVLVHHIDGNPRNNISANLMSLCNACHEEIHKKDRWGRGR